MITVQELIDILNSVDDKTKTVKYLDTANSSSNHPKWVDSDDAYFNKYSDSFLIC